MRIGVLSDTHIHDSAEALPARLVNDLKSVDMIIHCGDFVDLSVLEQLQQICQRVVAVWGNMDPQELRTVLRQKEVFSVENRKIAVTHGWGPPHKLLQIMMQEFVQEKPDIVIFGHAHEPTNQVIGGVLYFNPGSALDTIFAPFNSYGIITIGKKIDGEIIKL